MGTVNIAAVIAVVSVRLVYSGSQPEGTEVEASVEPPWAQTYHFPVAVPEPQTAGLAVMVEPVSAAPEIEGAAVAAAALAWLDDVSERPAASSKAAPTDTSFLRLIELVISSRKPKTGLKTGLN